MHVYLNDWYWLILIDIDWYWLILIDIDWYWMILIDIDWLWICNLRARTITHICEHHSYSVWLLFGFISQSLWVQGLWILWPLASIWHNVVWKLNSCCTATARLLGWRNTRSWPWPAAPRLWQVGKNPTCRSFRIPWARCDRHMCHMSQASLEHPALWVILVKQQYTNS